MIKAASVIPVKKVLDGVDPSGETWVQIKPATYRDEMVRGEMLKDRQYAIDDEYGVVTKVGVNLYQLHAEEIWICYHSAQIKIESTDEKTGKAIVQEPFKPKEKMGRGEFMAELARLPRAVVSEWHRRVTEVNSDWQYPF